MQAFAGIDSSSRSHLVQIVGQEGSGPQKIEVPNSVSGFRTLVAFLRKHGVTAVGIEQTHGPIIDFLFHEGCRIYCVNPLQIKRFKDLFTVSGDKNDAIDALAIGRFVAANHERLRPLILSSPEIEKLKVMGISHERLVQERSRLGNRMHFVLRQYFPLLDTLFSDVLRPVLAHFLLRFPTWESLKTTADEEIVAFLHLHRCRVPKHVARILADIRAYEHCIPESTEAPLSHEAQTIARLLLVLHESIAQVEEEMTRIVSVHRLGTVMKSLPGAGDLTAAKLVGILGDNPKRFGSVQGFQALMGTAPANYQSGGYHKVVMRRACNKRGRRNLFVFAFNSIRVSPWARKYYDSQRARGKTYAAAVRALSNKWARIIYRLWQTGECYDESRRVFEEAA